VGTPARVTATATEFFGYPPEQEMRFVDHHAYKSADVAKMAALRESGLEIVCTAKDAVKLADMVTFPLWVLEVEPVFQDSIDGLNWEGWLHDVWNELRLKKGDIRA
jgi:tetraacyldisaccharide-1-P 4'-kinase